MEEKVFNIEQIVSPEEAIIEDEVEEVLESKQREEETSEEEPKEEEVK